MRTNKIIPLSNDYNLKLKEYYENSRNVFKFVLYRPQLQSDNNVIPGVTLDVTLNGQK